MPTAALSHVLRHLHRPHKERAPAVTLLSVRSALTGLTVLLSAELVLLGVGGSAVPAGKEGPPPEASSAAGRLKLAAGKPRVDRLGDPLPPGVLARMGSGRLRHADTLETVAFSPDGR